MIKVANCVIHEIHKEAKKIEAAIDPSETLLDGEDEFVKKLLLHIHKSFGDSTSLKNTQFVEKQETKFSSYLISYLNSDDSKDFFDFSIESLIDLKEKIEKENFAVGGYYVFADYHYEDRRFISVMVIRKNKDAINLNKVNKVHKPAPSENVNTEKIAMGFRLNHGYFQSPDSDKNYIALLTNQQDKELSGYFKKWVNAAGVISNEKNTIAFVRIVKMIDIPKDEDGNDRYTREDFQKIAFDFAESNINKQINVNTFSAQVFGDKKADYIMNYATTNNIIIDPEFKRYSTTLKRLITIRAKVKGIELNVDYDRLNENEVDVREDGLVIIRSEELARQILDQKNDRTNRTN